MANQMLEKENLIINASALAAPEISNSWAAWTIKKFSHNLAREWPTISALYALRYVYGPAPSTYDCLGMWSNTENAGGLVKEYLSTAVINHYKSGKIDTSAFLDHLYNSQQFKFLQKVDFLGNYNAVVEKLKKPKPPLFSLFGKDMGTLKNEDIAKALLENAWAARMVFGDEAKAKLDLLVKHMGKRNESPININIISNSNPLDMWYTVQYLKRTMTNIHWHDDEALYNAIKTPANSLEKGIELAPNVKLYVSYAHKDLLDGKNVKTSDLLNHINNTENFDEGTVGLISQWQGDLDEAVKINMPHIKDGKFFDELGAEYSQGIALGSS